MQSYITVEQIWQQVRKSLGARIHEEDEAVRAAEAAGQAPPQRKYSFALLETPEYQRWVADVIAAKKKDGLLVTAQQLADIKARRRLRPQDRARFVGESRIEPTRAGRTYPRQHGETGIITEMLKRSDGKHIYTFMPDPPPGALEPDGPEVFLAMLQVREGTPGYFDLERIPEPESDKVSLDPQIRRES